MTVRYIGGADYGTLTKYPHVLVPAGQLVIVAEDHGSQLVASGEWEEVTASGLDTR